MRLLGIGLAAALLTASLYCSPAASAADRDNDHRRSMGNLRPSHPTAVPSIQGSPPPRARTNHQVYVPPPTIGHPGYPSHYHEYVPYGYGYRAYQPYGYGYGYYPPAYGYAYPRPYYRGYLYPPPVYLPAERLYGPQAVKRFMGVAP